MLALRPVVPDATISADTTNQMLIVTASEEDHLKIAAIVDEADRASDGELTTEVYSLKWANPTAVSYSIAPIAAQCHDQSRCLQQDVDCHGDGQGSRTDQDDRGRSGSAWRWGIGHRSLLVEMGQSR